MAKHGRGRREHRPGQRRHLHAVPTPPQADPTATQMFEMLRNALRDPEPIGLLMTVSGLLSAADERNRNPFDTTDQGVDLATLVESFIGVNYA